MKVKYRTVADKLQAIETYLDSVQLMKYTQGNRKVVKRIRRALGLVRSLQHEYPQRNYSLYGWIMDHQTPRAKLLRFSWRKYRRLRPQSCLDGGMVLDHMMDELTAGIGGRSGGEAAAPEPEPLEEPRTHRQLRLDGMEVNETGR